MHVRPIEWATLALSLSAGAALPIGALGGDSGRLLVTFLGLMSAGILPTLTLAIGNMTASGRSVQALDELEHELSAAVNALLALFGFGVTAVGGLLVLSLPSAVWGEQIPYFGLVAQRLVQGIVCGGAAMMVMQASQVPGILRRSLQIKHRIAVDEARRKTLEKAPSSTVVREAFPTNPDYGRTTKVG